MYISFIPEHLFLPIQNVEEQVSKPVGWWALLAFVMDREVTTIALFCMS